MDLPTSIYMMKESKGRSQSGYNWRSQLHNHPNYPNFEKRIFHMNMQVTETSVAYAVGIHALQCK